jgi:hypothetical protein
MFHRPDRERPIPVDPDWSDFWENAGIFNTVCEDLGISADEFVRRLNDSSHSVRDVRAGIRHSVHKGTTKTTTIATRRRAHGRRSCSDAGVVCASCSAQNASRKAIAESFLTRRSVG